MPTGAPTAADAARIDAIDALLAQTQCRECGYDACRPYAEAIAAGDGLHKCRPGGEPTRRALMDLLGRQAPPLLQAPLPAQVAWIDPERCIGCARCLPACPVDAIAGAQPLLHTVLPGDCTGCGLCVAPCPVDCIALHALPDGTTADALAPTQRDALRARYVAHVARAERRAREAGDRRAARLARLTRLTRVGEPGDGAPRPQRDAP